MNPNLVKRTRREEILDLAVELFAARGYHGVSMDDIGARAHITGPALYHHFKGGKEAMLAEALTPVSERLLSGGKEHADRHRDDPRAAVRALVEFHVDFALTSPAVIAVHLHELDRLPTEPRRQIRRLQRAYVEVWVDVLRRLRPELSDENARVLAHAAFGLLNSTPFLGRETLAERAEIAALLTEAALAALDPLHRTTPQDLTIVQLELGSRHVRQPADRQPRRNRPARQSHCPQAGHSHHCRPFGGRRRPATCHRGR